MFEQIKEVAIAQQNLKELKSQGPVKRKTQQNIVGVKRKREYQDITEAMVKISDHSFDCILSDKHSELRKKNIKQKLS